MSRLHYTILTYFMLIVSLGAISAQSLLVKPSEIGVFTNLPEFDVHVKGDLFLQSSHGGYMLGYANNGNQWRFSTVNGGADIHYRFKPDGLSTFTTRAVLFNTGDMAIGGSPGFSNARLEVMQNSTVSDPQLLLTEEANDFARLTFMNTTYTDKFWTIAGYTGSTSANSKINFFYSDASTSADRMTILGNGHVGIGNVVPDEELVVGTNIGSAWAIPAITVGNILGGALETGNSSYSLSMEASNGFARGRIISISPAGYGKGGIEIRANAGVSIGDSPGPANTYMLRVVHSALGLNIENGSTGEDWEIYSSSGGNMWLYHNNAFKGSFDGSTGAYTESSDRRLKSHIHRLEPVLNRVMNLQPSRYYYANDENGRETIGLIAQELEVDFPELVFKTADPRNPGVYSVNYSGLGPIAIKAIQELKVEIDAKDHKIESLEKRLAALEYRVAELSK